LFKLALCTLGMPLHSSAQEALPGLVHSNEVFARKLLVATHAANPKANIVLAPLPLSIQFAAIQSHYWLEEEETTQSELAATFDWDKYAYLARSSQMLLAGFSSSAWSVGGISHAASNDITTTVYTSPLLPDQIFEPTFLRTSQQYFGMTFKPAAHPFQPLTDGKIPVIVIDARMKLQLPWGTNLFSVSEPTAGDFHDLSGPTTRVTFLHSEMGKYPYVENDRYEAVKLPCGGGSMIVVLPAKGRSIAETETQLAAAIDELDNSLQPQYGEVALPMFHLHVKHLLRAPLDQIGIHHVFKTLGHIVKIKQGAYIEQISQDIDFTVDRKGIRANAKTFTISIAGGGIMGVPKPFSMIVDRPFIFLVRDKDTGATTFLGSVVELPKSDPQTE
jgi:serine protease inhibitor